MQAAVERGTEEAREHMPVLRVAGAKPVRTPTPTRAATTPSGGDASPAFHPAAHDLGNVGAPSSMAAFEILAEITRAILAQENINDTLAMVLEGIARTGGFDAAFLALLNARKDRLVGRLGYGEGVAEFLSALQVPVLPEAGVLAEAVLARETRVITQAGTRALMPRGVAPPTIAAESLVVHPLVVRGKAVGVLVAARGVGGAAITAAEGTLVQLFCNQAGLALDRAVH